MHILLKAWRKSQHDICDCWAKNMLNQQDVCLKLSHLPPSSLVLWWPLFLEDFPVWIPVCLYVRECPIMCNLQSDRPCNRQRKEKSVHNLICKSHIKLETESSLWTEILVLQVTRFRRFLKCDVGEKHWGAILITFWPIRLKRRASIPPYASLLLNRRTYIPLVNTISQERFKGFSSNFAQMSTLTWEWTD